MVEWCLYIYIYTVYVYTEILYWDIILKYSGETDDSPWYLNTLRTSAVSIGKSSNCMGHVHGYAKWPESKSGMNVRVSTLMSSSEIKGTKPWLDIGRSWKMNETDGKCTYPNENGEKTSCFHLPFTSSLTYSYVYIHINVYTCNVLHHSNILSNIISNIKSKFKSNIISNITFSIISYQISYHIQYEI